MIADVGAEVVVRPMDSADVTSVRAIDLVVYSRPWTSTTWQAELADPQRHHLVVGVADEVVGHAGALHLVDEVHVTTVAVHPDHQGRGLATLMVLDLLEEARLRKFDAATLEVRAADRRAQRIYSRLGFAPAGLRRRYYSGPVDDAIVMWVSGLDEPRFVTRHQLLRDSVLERVKASYDTPEEPLETMTDV